MYFFLWRFLCLIGLAYADYRLPKNVMPENYKLEVITHLGEKDNFNFEGKVWIQTTCVSPTQNITLHSKDLTIEEKTVTVKDTSSKEPKLIKLAGVSFDKTHDFLQINLQEALQEDHKYEVFIEFKGTLDDGLAGFYRSNYFDKTKKEKVWLGVTQFEAISARRAFPCFDEPEMKATFDISIGRKAGYQAISNMPLLNVQPMDGKEGWFWDKFDSSVPMSTYLVAYVVSDFASKMAEPSKSNNVTFKIWARKDAIGQVDFARDVGPKSLEFFEDFFNIKYPLPKQDMVAIPDFSAGAMENWGLVTYRENYLLYDPEVSSKTSQHNVASVIAHELAHQWFGNLVTMKWWTDLWLNEGFATYMASLAVHHLFPQWNSLEEEAASDVLNVFSFDSLRTSHPVSVPIGDPKEIDEIFDTISYKKGSSLIRMMGLFLGEQVLRKGVSNYLNEHKFGNAEQDDLWMALTKEAHKTGALPQNLTVKTIMDTWTLQTGYPVISVKRNYEKESVNLKQQRFLRDVITIKNDPASCWWVPLTYSSKSHNNFNETIPKNWLSCPELSEDLVLEKVAKKDDWLIFNHQLTGIYKVNYDQQNWKLIGQELNAGNPSLIPTLNRVQLLSDSADLAYIGDLPYDVFFDLIKYLKTETEYLPWKTALGKINTLTTQLKKSPLYGSYKDFMRKLLSPIYERTGALEVAQTKSDKLDSIKLQVLIVGKSCKFEVANCVSQAKDLFNKWKTSPEKPNPIPKDLRAVVYCTVLKQGDEKDWNFLWKQYQNSNVATEKNTILSSLGCTRELWLLSRYLEWSLKEDSGIRRQDCSTVFSAVAHNDLGYYLAKKFLFEKLNPLVKHIQPNKRRLTRYMGAIASQMTSQSDLEELNDFINKNKEVFNDIQKGVDQSLETVKINVQWQNKHLDQIQRILSNIERSNSF